MLATLQTRQTRQTELEAQATEIDSRAIKINGRSVYVDDKPHLQPLIRDNFDNPQRGSVLRSAIGGGSRQMTFADGGYLITDFKADDAIFYSMALSSPPLADNLTDTVFEIDIRSTIAARAVQNSDGPAGVLFDNLVVSV